MEKKIDPFKIDFNNGTNMEAEEPEKTDVAEESAAPTDGSTTSTKRELRQQKKREKELKRIADRKFEREAGLIGVKNTSTTLGIVGFIICIIPIITYIGATLLFIVLGLTTVFLILLFLAGFILIVPFFLAGGASIEDYFATATAPAKFATEVADKVSGLSDTLNVVCSASGLILQLAAAILLFISYKALCKKNKIKRTVFLSLGIAFAAVFLVFSVLNLNKA